VLVKEPNANFFLIMKIKKSRVLFSLPSCVGIDEALAIRILPSSVEELWSEDRWADLFEERLWIGGKQSKEKR